MIADASRERGIPPPQFILDAPFPEDSYQHRVLDAFWKLSTCRHIGMGVLGPIPWDSIDTFAHRNHFAADEIEYETFVYIIQQLDAAFLEHQRETTERESKRSGKAGSFRPPNARASSASSKKRR